MWCKGSYSEFWESTPAEVLGKITAYQKKERMDKSWLNAVIFNSQGPKEDGTPWQSEDFDQEEEPELSGEEIIKAQQKELELWHNWMNNCRKG